MEPGDGARDFDFLMGAWSIRNRRLRQRLRGSTEWEEFEASSLVRALPAGLGNQDEYRTEHDGGFTGLSLRFYDPAARRWSIHWADSRRGVLDPPVVGGFAGETGVFEGDDLCEGRPVRVRFHWRRDAASPRWEQAFSADGGRTWETNWVMDFTRPEAGFPVVELRRYVMKPGRREAFATFFESLFPEAFQQLGAAVFGQFLEREDASRFTWLRGYADYAARAAVGAAFYDGPVWKEHAAAANAHMLDSDDVLLLQAWPGRGLPVLPAVDPVAGPGAAGGLVVAQIFAVEPGAVLEFAQQAESVFGSYRALAGVREAGLLTSLEQPNNFPRHPVRADGPFLVWLGLVEDDRALAERLAPRVRESLGPLAATGLLRGAPEWVVLAPTRRSRLRWLPGAR